MKRLSDGNQNKTADSTKHEDDVQHTPKANQRYNTCGKLGREVGGGEGGGEETISII